MKAPDERHVQPAKWSWVGPPAPSWTRFAARACMATLALLTGIWVSKLGGLAVNPDVTGIGGGANDTGRLFNWHPLLMVLAFGVLMPEAMLSFRGPLVPSLRPTRKIIHWVLNSLAVAFIAIGLAAAILSHTLKRPQPTPNFYSAHSALGLFTVCLLALQFVLGFASYLWPKLPMSQRMALGPVHRFLGTATWTLGLAAIASGVQEKTTFVQTMRGLGGGALYSSVMRIPQVMLIFVALLLVFVNYSFAPAAERLKDEPGLPRSEVQAHDFTGVVGSIHA